MKRYLDKLNFPLSLVIALTGAVYLSQDACAQKFKDPERWYRKPQTIHGKSIVIPIGAHIEGRINDTISSKTRQGQRFSVEITSPILANGTDVIIPSGSRIVGEVVEAIPSSKQRRVKGMPKPIGKLRTQLSTLTTPDGMSYPIVASIMHEVIKSGKYSRENRDLSNPNMGYVGSQSQFDVVNPGFDKKPSGMSGPKTVGRREFMRDPIYGKEFKGSSMYGTPIIRAVRRQGNEIYIYSGSALSIRLDAPLKMSMAPSKGALSVDLDPVEPSLEEGSNDGSFRRFKPAGRPEEPPPQEVAPPPPVQQAPQEPDDGLPGFLKEKKRASFDNGFGGSQRQLQQQQQPPQFQQAPQFQQQAPPQFQQAPQFQQQAPPQFQQQQPPPQFQQAPPMQQAPQFQQQGQQAGQTDQPKPGDDF